MNLGMKDDAEFSGRFWPSRVYARWRMVALVGLLLVPLVMFLVGGIVVFLTPVRYESRSTFELRGGRPAAETAPLIRSRSVIAKAVEQLKLTQKLSLDRESVSDQIASDVTVTADPVANLTELRVEGVDKELARDLAFELPWALAEHEKTVATDLLRARLGSAKKFADQSQELSDQAQQNLAKAMGVHGSKPTDPQSLLAIESVRAEWEDARRVLGDARVKVAGLEGELAVAGPALVMHSEPVIGQQPVSPGPASVLGDLVLQSLLTGLAIALLAPYLCELVRPPGGPKPEALAGGAPAY